MKAAALRALVGPFAAHKLMTALGGRRLYIPRKSNEDRDRAIFEARSDHSIQQVARSFRLSRRRVHEIIRAESRRARQSEQDDALGPMPTPEDQAG